jgi:hypothetical protein
MQKKKTRTKRDNSISPAAQATTPKVTKHNQRPAYLELDTPITIRLLSEELGVRAVELVFKAKEHGVQANLKINSVIDGKIAQLIALDFKCDLRIKTIKTPEEKRFQEYLSPEFTQRLVEHMQLAIKAALSEAKE